VQMLIHDLGDLSYLVERYTKDEALLARADALVEHRMDEMKRHRLPAASARTKA
jgi:hypothetical protein